MPDVLALDRGIGESQLAAYQKALPNARMHLATTYLPVKGATGPALIQAA
jgi:hypothetical protein